jgi:ribosomal protein S18 acetylase RimI-like enzyme
MSENILIRAAQPADAERASLLLYSAYIHTQIMYPPQEAQNQFLDRIQIFFRKEGNRCSYQFIQVAELQSEVVGLVLSFGGQDEERLNSALGWQIGRESKDDEWYVDALAVFANWSRQGIGTLLLRAAEQQGLQHRYSRVALNVAQENAQARALYQHLHYIVTAETFLYGQPHLRMVKQLKA